MSDLISRQAAIKAIYDLPNCNNGYSDTYDKSRIISVIEELPSEEPKKGKWIDVDPHGDSGLAFECSECEEINLRESNYCPNCGADMRGEP